MVANCHLLALSKVEGLRDRWLSPSGKKLNDIGKLKFNPGQGGYNWK